jgi:hypothetical protein
LRSRRRGGHRKSRAAVRPRSCVLKRP